jgi:hypothetical protein
MWYRVEKENCDVWFSQLFISHLVALPSVDSPGKTLSSTARTLSFFKENLTTFISTVGLFLYENPRK